VKTAIAVVVGFAIMWLVFFGHDWSQSTTDTGPDAVCVGLDQPGCETVYYTDPNDDPANHLDDGGGLIGP
jgi:hypothetical protein